MSQTELKTQFAICISNENYPASLEIRKVYQIKSDRQASKHNLIRVIDESGKTTSYPASYFVAIELPKAATSAFISV